MHYGNGAVRKGRKIVFDLGFQRSEAAGLHFKNILVHHHVGNESPIRKSDLVKIRIFREIGFDRGVEPFFGKRADAGKSLFVRRADQ